MGKGMMLPKKILKLPQSGLVSKYTELPKDCFSTYSTVSFARQIIKEAEWVLRIARIEK